MRREAKPIAHGSRGRLEARPLAPPGAMMIRCARPTGGCMQRIKVAAVSMNGLLGQAEQNLARIEQWARCAREAGAELVLFPELVVHGHCDPRTWYNAERVPDGPATQRLCGLARELGMFLSVGLSEKDRDLVYNTQVLAGPQGYIGAQRKIHLSRDEVLYYKGGSDMPVFDIGLCK